MGKTAFPNGITVENGADVVGGDAPGGGTRLLGPYRVNFDTSGLAGGGVGVEVDTLPVGAIVIRATVIVRTTWSVDDSAGRYIELGVGVFGGSVVGAGSWWVDDDNAGGWPEGGGLATEYTRAVDVTGNVAGRIAFAQQAQPFSARQLNAAGVTPPSTGAADIYALIAVPAS